MTASGQWRSLHVWLGQLLEIFLVMVVTGCLARESIVFVSGGMHCFFPKESERAREEISVINGSAESVVDVR